jgi:hypothetical protein
MHLVVASLTLHIMFPTTNNCASTTIQGLLSRDPICVLFHLTEIWIGFVGMDMRTRAFACSQAYEWIHYSLKYFEASVTNILKSFCGWWHGYWLALLVNLRKFIEEECMAGLCSMERGGALTHKHFQMVMKGHFSSPPMFDTRRLNFV